MIEAGLADAPAAPTQRRRRVRYLGEHSQRLLLGALVLMEVLLVLAALAVLNLRLGTALDESMYRVHQEVHTLLPMLQRETLWVLLGLLAANTLAVLAAERRWRDYVAEVALVFRVLNERTARLDLKPPAAPVAGHRVLDLVSAWRAAEHARCARVRAAVNQLREATPDTAEGRSRIAAALEQIEAALP